MTKTNSQNENSKDERRYDPELLKEGLRCDLDQYEMLMRCSDNNNISEWNEWRKKHPEEEIWLEGAEFYNSYLMGINLKNAHLKKAVFKKETNLRNAIFRMAHSEGAILMHCILEDADIGGTLLQAASFIGVNLKGADFTTASVDSETIIWKPRVNRISKNKYTDFTGVALDNLRIDPGTKQLLEYNIRRNNWELWYLYKDCHEKCKKKRNIIIQLLMYFIRLFWSFSDYGRSIGRVVYWFFGLALLFAAIYSLFAYISPPGIVSNLEVEPHLPLWHYGVLVFLRPIYFSIVTMTTLGFGDMYANAQSIWGHILLTIQVILGYVLLGALVTRFAVLFTAGGPAGKFADEKEQNTETRRHKTDDK